MMCGGSRKRRHPFQAIDLRLKSPPRGRLSAGSGRGLGKAQGGFEMSEILRKLWSQEEGQDIAEYAVMLAVILVIVVGTIRLIGSNANNVFSSVASSIAQ